MTRRNIPTAYAAAFVKNLQFFGAIAVPFFLDWLKVDYTRMFMLQAWFLFWVFALEIPTGVVADKFGRKISVGLGCLCFAVDMLMFGLTRNYPLLFVAEFVGAIGMTLMSGAEQALLYDSLVALGREDRARHFFGRYEAASTLGMLVGFPAGSYIGTRAAYPTGLPVPFLLTAAAVVVAGVLFLSMREPTRAKPTEGFLAMGVNGLRTLFVRPALRAYVLNSVTISAVTFFAYWFYQPVCLRAGMSVAHLGLVAAALNLFAALLLGQVPRLERAFGLRRLLLASALAPGLLFLALGVVHRLAFAVPALLLIVGGKMVRVPILNDFINRHVESENRATVISSVSLVERSITFLLYPVVGILADRSLDLTLGLLGTLCVTFALVTRLEDRHLGTEGDPKGH